MLALEAQGKKIKTAEALADGGTLDPVPAAFVHHDAQQYRKDVLCQGVFRSNQFHLELDGVSKTFLGELLVRKIVLVREAGNAGLQATRNSVASQIIRSIGQRGRLHQPLGLSNSKVRESLEFDSVYDKLLPSRSR